MLETPSGVTNASLDPKRATALSSNDGKICDRYGLLYCAVVSGWRRIVDAVSFRRPIE
jgi:hypothetical protein